MTVEMKSNMSKPEWYSRVIHLIVALALIVSLGLVMTPLATVGAATQNEEFTESGTFVVPETVTQITVQAWGGGAAGGGSTNAGFFRARGGAGGGGGAYADSILTVEPGQELQLVVGAGGTGVSGADGNAGSPSFVGPDSNPDNAFVRAATGSGGTGNTAGGSPAGGAGGTVEDSIGQNRISGGDGGDGATGWIWSTLRSGAGGDGANGGGSGGAALTSGTSNGNPGDMPGGGGGGARTSQDEGAQAGGAGAAGKIIISWVTHDLTISSMDGGSVTTPGEGIFTYGKEAVVDLVAEAEEGYRFVEWTGDVGTIDDVYAVSTTITMNDDYSITAEFIRQFDLTTSSTAGGSVTTPGEALFTYDDGTVIDLVAEAEEGYRFVEWTGDVGTIDDVYAVSTTITMNDDYSITAEFIRQFDLTTSSTAGGSVTTPGEALFTYDDGTVIDLVAEAEEGYQFVEWTGDVGSIADVYASATTVTMNGDYSITAEFVREYHLTISSTAGGLVTTPGEGLFIYNDLTVVNLVAEAEEGCQFVGWTGDVGTIEDAYAATTSITMNGDYSITANFMVIYDLTVSSTEGGSVTTPGEGVFTYGEISVVGLSAEAEEEYRFVEWTGDVGTIADVYAVTTTVTMNGDYSITADFEAVPLSVTTKAATDITAYSSTLNMDYTVGDFSPVEVRFAYKKSAGLFWSYTDWVSKSTSGTHAEMLTGLNPETDYDFIAQFRHNDIEIQIEGTTLHFTTDVRLIPPPTGGCFIATAAYGTSTAEQIDVLREFRDSVLLESTAGSVFVSLYYQLSPPVADFIAGNELLRTMVRELLIDPIVRVVEATGDIWEQ